MIIKLLLSVVLTETITELLVKSEFFMPLRKFIFEKGSDNKVLRFIHNILDCGYCTSVWIGFLIATILLKDFSLINPFVDWFFMGLLVHRLSNYLHNIVDKISFINEV